MAQRVDLHPGTKSEITKSFTAKTDENGRPNFTLRAVLQALRDRDVKDPVAGLVSLSEYWRTQRPEMAMQLGRELANAYHQLFIRARQLANAHAFIVEHTAEPKELGS